MLLRCLIRQLPDGSSVLHVWGANESYYSTKLTLEQSERACARLVKSGWQPLSGNSGHSILLHLTTNQSNIEAIALLREAIAPTIEPDREA